MTHFPGQTADIYAIDVEGTRLIVMAFYGTDAVGPALLAQVEEIIASLAIER